MATYTNGHGSKESGFLHRLGQALFGLPADYTPDPAPPALDTVPVEQTRGRRRALRVDSIAAQMRAARVARGLSQEAAALALGTNRRQYQKWEQGTVRPGETQRPRIRAWLHDDAPAVAPEPAPVPAAAPTPLDLRAARHARGWTGQEVADQLGCSVALIHALEVGKFPTSAVRPRLVALYAESPTLPAPPDPEPPPVLAYAVPPLAEPNVILPQFIGDVLTAWMDYKGLDVAALQALSGAQTETILRWQKDSHRHVHTTTITKLAQLFGVTPQAFLDGPPPRVAPAVAVEEMRLVSWGGDGWPLVTTRMTRTSFDAIAALVREA